MGQRNKAEVGGDTRNITLAGSMSEMGMFQQLGFPLIRSYDRPIIFLVEQKQIRRLWFWFWVLVVAVVWFWPGFGTRAIKTVSSPAQPPASSPAK